jgi:hypothetical protein
MVWLPGKELQKFLHLQMGRVFCGKFAEIFFLFFSRILLFIFSRRRLGRRGERKAVVILIVAELADSTVVLVGRPSDS